MFRSRYIYMLSQVFYQVVLWIKKHHGCSHNITLLCVFLCNSPTMLLKVLYCHINKVILLSFNALHS